MLDLLKPIFTNVWYVVLIALFFGGSIFVHELGHFLAARRRGLKIDRFSIGFGPKIFAWVRHGVEYRLSWIPLGGYVALPQLADMRGIEGEPGSDAAELPPISYTDKMIVAVMGAVFNLIFAFVLACVLWAIRQPISDTILSHTIGYVVPTVKLPDQDEAVPSPAAAAGLQAGDKILSIDGRTIEDWRDVNHAIITGSQWSDDGQRQATFVVERAGRVLPPIEVHPLRRGDDNVRQVGIGPAYDVFVYEVPPGSLAEHIGLRSDDQLLSLAGVAIRNDQTYSDILAKQTQAPLDLVINRQGTTLTLTVPPRPFPIVQGVIRNSVAHRLGIRDGDVLLTVDGEPLTTGEKFVDAVKSRTAKSFTLSVRRGAETLSFEIPPRPNQAKLGILPGYDLGESLRSNETWVRITPFKQFADVISESYRTLLSLLNPGSDIGLSAFSGPVEIVRVYHMAAQSGIRALLWLTILVNISLALFNLLPIPVLDGGHMLFATIGKLRNRPLPANFLMTTQSVFMMLLFTMVIYVTFFNIRRWARDAREEREEQSVIRPTDPVEIAPAPAPAAVP